MKKYKVTISNTEIKSYEVYAKNERDAVYGDQEAIYGSWKTISSGANGKVENIVELIEEKQNEHR